MAKWILFLLLVAPFKTQLVPSNNYWTTIIERSMRSSLSPLSRLLKFKPNQLHYQWSKPTPLSMEQNHNLRRSHRNHIVCRKNPLDSTKNQRHLLSNLRSTIRCFKENQTAPMGDFRLPMALLETTRQTTISLKHKRPNCACCQTPTCLTWGGRHDKETASMGGKNLQTPHIHPHPIKDLVSKCWQTYSYQCTRVYWQRKIESRIDGSR